MKHNGQHRALSRRLEATRNAAVPSSYSVPTGLAEKNKTGVAAQSTGVQFTGPLAAEKARRKTDRFAQQNS